MDQPRTGLPEPRARSPFLRALAPIALVAALVAVVVVASNSGVGEEEPARSGQGQTTQSSGGGGGGGAETPEVYVVESGDSLGTIAERFGISVKRIERLNKGVDPNTLATGQELKLQK